MGAISCGREVDVIVVGAGFGGLYALHRLRTAGLELQVFEAAEGIGGTWYWNCYPGARCDVESVEYSYSFSEELDQDWEWSERYAAQPEILRYIEHVADRFDLRKDIQLETRVTAARFDESVDRWTVETDDGRRHTAQFLVMTAGCLSIPNVPDLPGLESFAGRVLHTGRWPQHGVDFEGQQVAVFGTGSSGIQVIPEIARQADHVSVLQRTANYSMPAGNGPLDPEYVRELKARYPEHREAARQSFFGNGIVEVGDGSALDVSDEERRREFDRRWALGGAAWVMTAYNDLIVDEAANAKLVDYVHSKIEEMVGDPETAHLLCPTGYPAGTKRVCQHTDYYDAYNRDDVTLIDLRTAPVTAVVPDGLQLADGRTIEAQSIVFATGFDAITGSLLAIDIQGRGGRQLRDKWADGPRNYLGLMVAGFPNLFTVTGPGSPSVLSNMVMAIEQHVDLIADLVIHLRELGLVTVEAGKDAEDAWVEHVNEVAHATLYPRTDSWYMGANIPGKPRVFLPYVGGIVSYRVKCEEVVARGYEGFLLSGTSVTA